MTKEDVEFRVLGPLEVWSGGEQLALGGAKQRAVLAVLLLRVGETVPLERLIDDVWGDDPPPSAAHTLESYVSRLRQLLHGLGPVLSRRGAGYAIDLHGAQLDAAAFVDLQESAALASALDEHANVLELATLALDMWRGPALADVALASAGRAEAERLEELRLRTYELRFDAELALGRHERVVGEVQALIAQNPYRERFVAQSMLALYRSGRHAEALDGYERMRRRLDDDLGLQPSADLQQLSGRIVRQDPSLERERAARQHGHGRASMTTGGRRRVPALLVAGAVVASMLVVTASGGAVAPDRTAVTAKRLLLVLPASPTPGVAARGVSKGVVNGEYYYDLHTHVAHINSDDAQAGADRVASRIRSDRVGLVVALGDGPEAQALAPVVRGLPTTRFVFVDASLRTLGLEGVPNAAAIRFSAEDALLLGGHLSGLMPTLNESKRRIDQVSVVAGAADRDTKKLVASFKHGLRETNPKATVRVDYSHELDDVTACERLANTQIDGGSDVVIAAAGHCGLGAIEVARARGVWAIGAEEDGVSPGPLVLMTTHKEWAMATLFAIEKLVYDALPLGRETVLGIEDDYAVGFSFSDWIPAPIQSKLVDRCSRIRATRHIDF